MYGEKRRVLLNCTAIETTDGNEKRVHEG